MGQAGALQLRHGAPVLFFVCVPGWYFRGYARTAIRCFQTGQEETIDRYLSIEAFVRVAETRNFAEAARQLGVSGSVVTHRVQQLEQFVSAPLFHRSTRHVRLSEVGEAFYHECAETVARINNVTDQMRELHATSTGRLRIQILPGFALGHFGVLLAGFSEQCPDIQLDIIVNDRVVNPVEEGFDVAFQIFPPIAGSLIQRPLFPVRRLFCAAPCYIDKHGEPEHPRDLAHHRTAVYSGYPSRSHWIMRYGDEVIEIDLPGMVRSNSVHLLRDYALTGSAIVCLPTLVASEVLISGALVPVLTDYVLDSFQFAAVYPATQRQAPKVRALVDFLIERLGLDTAWDKPLIERGWVV